MIVCAGMELILPAKLSTNAGDAGRSLVERMQNGETAMLAPLELKPIDLKTRTVHRIQNPSGQEVCCVRGRVWVTQAHRARGIMLAAIRGFMGTPRTQEARDTILASGQSVVLDRRGLA